MIQIVSEKGFPVKSNLSGINWITLHIDPVYTNEILDFDKSFAYIQFHKIEKGGLSGYKVAGTEDFEQMCTDSEGYFLETRGFIFLSPHSIPDYPRRHDNLYYLGWGLLQYLALDQRTDPIFSGDYWRYMQDYYSNPDKESLNKPCVFIPGLWFKLNGEFKYNLANSFLVGYIQEMQSRLKSGCEKKETEKKKGGCVYFIQNTFTLDVKIGMTASKNAKNRLKDLQTASSHPLVILKTVKCDDPATTEKNLHKQFSHLRLSGEWFKYEDDLKTYLESSVKALAKKKYCN